MHSTARDHQGGEADNGLELLLTLKEQMHRIEAKLENLASGGQQPIDPYAGALFRFDDDKSGVSLQPTNEPKRTRVTKPPLPDPRLVRRVIRNRHLRARFFDGDLFADPAWDILLDLTAARAEHTRVSVTSLCIASGVPPTTALRWISQMVESGLLQRVEDDIDRRRAFITLTDHAADAMARYFAEHGLLGLA